MTNALGWLGFAALVFLLVFAPLAPAPKTADPDPIAVPCAASGCDRPVPPTADATRPGARGLFCPEHVREPSP